MLPMRRDCCQKMEGYTLQNHMFRLSRSVVQAGLYRPVPPQL